MTFKPDQPIQSYQDDLLSRHAFSQSLANAICSYNDVNSIVIGLYGTWGTGKTSILNMSLEHIVNANIELPEEERTTIIRFNPWNYSDQNQLILQFFKQLSIDLQRSDSSKNAQKIGSKLEMYASFFEPLVLIPHPWVSLLFGGLAKVFKGVGKASSNWGKNKEKDLISVKDELNELLANRKAKHIIVIDDIDRLNNTEIRQIFQLIKSLGDFSNTVYLLAFDKSVVVNALTKVQEGSGEDYLEKIIQIPFEVPLADKNEIEKLLFSQLNLMIHDIPEDRWNQTYWGNIYHSGIRHFINTIRDVTRYVNSLRLSLEMVKEELNPIDFLAITALQVFQPEIYIGIRENKDIFAGESKDRSSDERKKSEKEICESIISKVKRVDRNTIEELLKRLFPKMEAVFGGSHYGGNWLDTWRKEGRICSPDLFEIFFRLSLPKSEISQKEITNILSKANKYEEFLGEMISLKKDGKAVRFLERLEDYTREDIPPENFNNVISVLMEIGDSLPEGNSGFWGIDSPMRILRISHQLLRRIEDKSERYKILKDAIEKTDSSLFTVVHEVSIQGQEHGRDGSKEKPNPEEKLTLKAEDLDKLEQIASKKISEWAENGKLSDHRNLINILYRWERWKDKNKVDVFVKEMIKTDAGIVKFITSFLQKTSSYGMSDYVGKINWNIHVDSVKHFVDIDDITIRVREIYKKESFEGLAEKQKQALKIFLDTIDGKIKDSPFDR
jgi:predicted KAP-like P-loop ATPase